MAKIKLDKNIFDELIGALVALSISQGGSKYIDELVEKSENEMEVIDE